MENQKKEVWLRKALFLIVSLALFFPMMAQTITVKGVVKESMTGEPIISANVAVKGTTNGTISDISGMYQISNVSSNAVLIVSYIGYKTAEIPVNGKNTINVSLEEESIGLQEVVAVGYGSQKKKELTGSVAGLKEGDLIKGVQSDPMGMLQGKVAGLNISKPNAGDPNGEYKFQLRGTSSLTGNTSPLIVIDGIPQGDLSAIPQDDIESIDVLKDGSAAAIYGTRGTNGVILVTTKRGSAGKMSVTYNGYMSISSIANQLEVMDRDQFLANGGNDRGYDTNWMDEITRTPFSHSHNLALTGGTTDFNYRASVSYRNNQGIALKSGFNEMIARRRASSITSVIASLLSISNINQHYRSSYAAAPVPSAGSAAGTSTDAGARCFATKSGRATKSALRMMALNTPTMMLLPKNTLAPPVRPESALGRAMPSNRDMPMTV